MKIQAGKAALVALALFLLWIGLRHSPELGKTIRSFVEIVGQAGPWGLLLYSLAVAATVVLLLPGLILTLGGGYLFGAIPGTALFMAGETLGACVAFGLAQTFLGTRTRHYLLGRPKLGVFNESLAAEGWKFIALTRMTPFFPFKLSNYLFGALRFRFSDFFWGTLLGTLPLSFVMVYLGSLLPDLTGLESRNTMHSPWARGFAVTTGVLAVIGLILISRRAGRSYRQKIADWEQKKK